LANFGNGVWLVESDATNNDDWITDHSGDPEELTITNYTEGIECWTVEYAHIERYGQANVDVQDLPGWFSIDLTFEEGHSLIKVSGTYQGTTFNATKEKGNNLMRFFRNHSDLSDKPFYFVKRWAEDEYELFYDENRAELKYMKAKFTNVPKFWIEERVLHFEFVLRSV